MRQTLFLIVAQACISTLLAQESANKFTWATSALLTEEVLLQCDTTPLLSRLLYGNLNLSSGVNYHWYRYISSSRRVVLPEDVYSKYKASSRKMREWAAAGDTTIYLCIAGYGNLTVEHQFSVTWLGQCEAFSRAEEQPIYEVAQGRDLTIFCNFRCTLGGFSPVIGVRSLQPASQRQTEISCGRSTLNSSHTDYIDWNSWPGPTKCLRVSADYVDATASATFQGTILDVSADGPYLCFASGPMAKEASYKFSILVLREPALVLTGQEEAVEELGSRGSISGAAPMILTCEALGGKPPVRPLWYIDGMPLGANDPRVRQSTAKYGKANVLQDALSVLTLPRDRQLSGRRLQCRLESGHSLLREVVSRTVTIGVYYFPQPVKEFYIKSNFFRFACEVFDSYPRIADRDCERRQLSGPQGDAAPPAPMAKKDPPIIVVADNAKNVLYECRCSYRYIDNSTIYVHARYHVNLGESGSGAIVASVSGGAAAIIAIVAAACLLARRRKTKRDDSALPDPNALSHSLLISTESSNPEAGRTAALTKEPSVAANNLRSGDLPAETSVMTAKDVPSGVGWAEEVMSTTRPDGTHYVATSHSRTTAVTQSHRVATTRSGHDATILDGETTVAGSDEHASTRGY